MSDVSKEIQTEKYLFGKTFHLGHRQNNNTSAKTDKTNIYTLFPKVTPIFFSNYMKNRESLGNSNSNKKRCSNKYRYIIYIYIYI